MFTITPETQKHSASHFATIPLKPTILSGFKASDPTLPPSTSRIKFVPAVPRLHPRIALLDQAVFSYFTADSKQQNDKIAARIGGIAKTISCLTIPKNHIATSHPHPPQILLPPSHLYHKSSHFTYPSPLPPDQPF